MGTSETQLDELFEALGKDKKNGINAYRASDVRISSHVPYGISTRIPELDLALGRPGYPVGRIIELFGLPRCGKTTAALMSVAATQKIGGSGLWIDSEFAFDPDRAEELGVNIDNMRISGAETIEEIFNIIRKVLIHMTEYSKPFIIVVDSVTAVPTQWEVNKNSDMAVDKPADQAKVIRKGLRIITPLVAKKNVLLLMINHAHETMQAWGKTTKAGGGHGIKFGASARVLFSNRGEIKEEYQDKKKKRLGQKIHIEVEKVKGAHLVFDNFDIDLLNIGGFNVQKSLLNSMVTAGIIKKANMKTYQWGEKSFQMSGWEEAINGAGGYEQVYKGFLQECYDKGMMKPYNGQQEKQKEE